MEEAVVLPGVYAKALLTLRGKNADQRLRQRGVRHVRLPGDGRRSSTTPRSPTRQVRQVKAAGGRPARIDPGPAGRRSRTPWSPTSSGAWSARWCCCSSSAWSRSRSSSWCPRLAGAAPETWPPATSAGPPTRRRPSRLTAERLGFNDPIYVQYGRLVKGIFVGADYDYGAGVGALPGALLRLLVHHPARRSGRTCSTGCRSPLSLALGAAVIWLVAGVADRRALRAAARQRLRPGRDGRRAGRRLAADLLHRPAVAGPLQLQAGLDRAGRQLHARSTENPADWAYDLLLPWITLAFLFAAAYARLTRAGMLETMGEDYIRTARAKGLPERTVITKHGLRAALTPIVTIFGLDLGLLLGGAVLTESTFSLPGLGKYAIDAIATNDLPKVLGVVDARRVLRRRRQPDRRPALRRRRPAGEARLMTPPDRRPSSRSATCASTSRPTTAWSSPSTGCRSRSSAARRSASSASPAPASP